MRSMAYNLAMNSGMWTAVQCLEENYRKFTMTMKQKDCRIVDKGVQITKFVHEIRRIV